MQLEILTNISSCVKKRKKPLPFTNATECVYTCVLLSLHRMCVVEMMMNVGFCTCPLWFLLLLANAVVIKAAGFHLGDGLRIDLGSPKLVDCLD